MKRGRKGRHAYGVRGRRTEILHKWFSTPYLGEIATDVALVLTYLSDADDIGTDVITSKLSTLAMAAAYCQFLWNSIPEFDEPTA